MLKKTLFIIFLLSLSVLMMGQSIVKVREILENPLYYKDRTITVVGVVTQYFEGDEFIPRHYLFRDASGEIKIYTARRWPPIGNRYSVIGTVIIDPKRNEVGIVEQSITEIEKSYKVEDILKNPQEYNNEVVTIKGFVTQLVPGTAKNTAFYLLRDDWGGVLKIRTSKDLPKINEKYIVTGPIGIDLSVTPNEVYLSEEIRKLESEIGTVPTGAPVISEEKPTIAMPTKKWWQRTSSLLLLGLIVIGLAIVITFFFAFARKREEPETIFEVEKGKALEKEEIRIPEPEQVLEGDTVKMAMPPAGTLKMLPGRLIVLQGDTKVKEIRFYKTKAEDENEITFGRAAGKPYSHIQLKEMTVSAKQAKIIYAGKKFTLINYSKTNPTRVNDIEIEENGMIELKDGDKIQMGEVIFEFRTH